MGEFVAMGYKTTLKNAVNHVKYIAFRERELGSGYGLFNDEKDNVDVKAFCDSLDIKKTSHKDIAKIHTMLISMSGDEWERSKFEEDDYKTMVRNMMEQWQAERGIKVDWVAAIHNEPGHPHVHVAIKSVCEDRNGVERRLKMKFREDKKFFQGTVSRGEETD